MFLRDSELKNTAERVCNGYSKLTNVDEGQGGSKLFPLFTHCHLATVRDPGDEAHDDGEAAADRTSFPTPDTSGTCDLASAVGAIGGRAAPTQATFVRSASSAQHTTASSQNPGNLGAHAPNASASAGLDELACTGSNNMSAKMVSRMHAIARTHGVSVM